MFVNATLMRGGTSKCWVLDARELPSDRDVLGRLLVEMFGGRDPAQLDGVGGGTPVTSKAAIVGPSATVEGQLDYLFAQVGVGTGTVEWQSNCGNCASGVALWALAHGLVTTTGGASTMTIRNVNTGTMFHAEVGQADADFTTGRAIVPGVRGTGIDVRLSFVDPQGGTTGALLPTGSARTELAGVAASLIDAGAPVALVPAAALDLPAAAGVAELTAAVPTLRQLRRRAALAMGLAREGDPIRDSVPKIGLAGPPVAYRTLLGEELGPGDYDLSVRMLSMTAPHPSIGLTSAVALAFLARTPGSILDTWLDPETDAPLRIGTLSGVLSCRLSRLDGHLEVTLDRAARVLAEAKIPLRDGVLAA
ncbi:PrpF domain-containing protein [Enemella evansiae]|uniref:PrpF domain-containing protein n=1 Tax=Enemella evansiae TaxID=2016499 RepID=UPI000B979806|nr:PrpF domain-containing protein [Enemella evansiae]OYN98862.1 PrpF, AcnD-accessory [Enemella evansiae]